MRILRTTFWGCVRVFFLDCSKKFMIISKMYNDDDLDLLLLLLYLMEALVPSILSNFLICQNLFFGEFSKIFF